jgi:hypothetical protein
MSGEEARLRFSLPREQSSYNPTKKKVPEDGRRVNVKDGVG